MANTETTLTLEYCPDWGREIWVARDADGREIIF